MIQIRSQSDLDSYTSSGALPNNEMVAIYALPNGETYKVNKEISLLSDSYVKGFNMPKIEWTADIDYEQTKAVFTAWNASSTYGQTKNNIVIDGLYIIGKRVSGTLIGIFAEKNGFSLEPYTEHDMDFSSQGFDKNASIGITIKNCIIEDCTYGIKMVECSFSKVINNKMRSVLFSPYAMDNGINLYRVKGSIFTRNTVNQCYGEGIYCSSVYTSVFKENLILTANGGGFYFYFSGKNVINSNVITWCPDAIYLYATGSCAITNNRIRSSSSKIGEGAITMDYYCRRNAIDGNIITESSGGIIILADCSTNTVTNNIIERCTGVGLKTNTSGGFNTGGYNSFYGNTVTNNTTATSFAGTGNINNVNMTTNI